MERERYPSWLNMQLPEEATDSSADKKDGVPNWLSSSKGNEEQTMNTKTNVPTDLFKDIFFGSTPSKKI